MKAIEARRAELEKAAAEDLAKAKARAKAINGVELVIPANAGSEGKLFGSVGPIDIAEAMASIQVEVERAEVRMPDGPIHELGEFHGWRSSAQRRRRRSNRASRFGRVSSATTRTCRRRKYLRTATCCARPRQPGCAMTVKPPTAACLRLGRAMCYFSERADPLEGNKMVRALGDGPANGGAEQRLKVPPNSIEAEQALIGGLMLNAQAWDKVADVIVGEDFYRKDHRLIFAAIANLVEDGSPCDVVTVSEYLDGRGELEHSGGLEYLATLANETAGAANARAYAKILRERSMLRALINAGNEISGSAFASDGRTAAQVLDDAERMVFEIAEKGSRGRRGFKSLKQILPAAVDRIDMLHQSEGSITGISNWLQRIRQADCGTAAGDLVIIAGRPSMGKTTLRCQYRRERGDRLEGADRDFLDGNAFATAGVSHDFLAGPRRSDAPSHR